MNQKERLVGTLHREEVDAVPCMGPMQTGILGLMQASGSFWPEVHRNPRKMADLALAANRFAGLESARVPFETAVDASALGVRISDRGLRRQPMVLERRISTAEGFAEVSVPDPRKDGIVPIVLEAIRDLEKRVPHLPIICGIMAPHMLAFELLGEQVALSMMVNDPSLLKANLRRAQKFGIDYAEAAHDAGADVAFIDPLASGDFLSCQQYLEFAFPFHRRICDETKKLGIPVILDTCGNTPQDPAPDRPVRCGRGQHRQ